MKKRLMNKIRSRAGESIGETLVALLISSLALVMLACAVSAGSGVITRGRDTLKTYYAANEAMVGRTNGTAVPDNGVTITDKTGAITAQSFGIEYYLNNTFGKTPVISYRKSG